MTPLEKLALVFALLAVFGELGALVGLLVNWIDARNPRRGPGTRRARPAQRPCVRVQSARRVQS